MSELVAQDVTVHYPGQPEPSLAGVSLSIGLDDLTVALGPSGCGKTTLLNVLAGFLPPSGGQVSFDGRPIVGPSAERAVVFQHDALLPWLNVRDNVAFGLRLQGVAKAQRRQAADRMLQLVGLERSAQRYSWELSGGMRQRVGIARALASQSRVLLMDEPFGALDAFTREQMQELLLKVWAQAGRRIFLITHDIEEALFLATELVLMSPGPGRIVERIRPTFSQRYREGESARALKSDPLFIELREHLLATLYRHRQPQEEALA